MASKRVRIFTCAQNGAKPHEHFLAGLETLANQYHTDIEIGVTNGKKTTSRRGKDSDEAEVLDPILREKTVVLFEEDKTNKGKVKVNSNLYVRNFPVKAQQMIPLTSYDRFVKVDKSAIMFSPKMMLQCQANLGDIPKILHSTGAVTRPNYKNNSWGVKATLDHTLGALLVEVENDNIFHLRQIVPNGQGVFYDLGVRYDGQKSPVRERVEALIPGDWHTGSTEPSVRDATYRLMRELDPRKLVVQDLCDSKSISHHNEKDIIYKALLAVLEKNDLHKEILACRFELETFLKKGGEDMQILIPRGNHDDHITRYLQEGRFKDDPVNYFFALALSREEQEGRYCLEEGMNYLLKRAETNPSDFRKSAVEYAKTLKRLENVRFLGKSESCKIHGVEVGCHGDLGANGTRGSITSVSKTLGNCFVGHSHTPGIFRDAWQVGTSTYLRLGYNEGPSSWLNTAGIIHPNGKKQLINFINGKYKP